MTGTPIPAVSEVRDGFSKLVEESQNLLVTTESEPLPNSIAANELKSFVEPVALKTAYGQSEIILDCVSDFSTALLKILKEPIEAIAPWSLARSVLEASATSIWLGSPEISAEERVSRSLSMWFVGLHEQRKLAAETPQVSAPKPSSFQRLEETAARLNIPIVRKGGKTTRIGSAWLGATELCGSELNEKATYRLFSGQAHSQPLAILGLNYGQIQPSTTDADLVVGEMRITEESLLFILQQSASAYVRSVAARLKLYGYLNEHTLDMLRTRWRQMKIRDDHFQYCVWSA